MPTLELQTRKATLRANSYNPETRRFIATAATETPVRMMGVEEVLVCREGAVDLGRMPVPLLRDHRRSLDDQLGTVLRAWFEAGAMLVEVQLTERAAATYGRDLEAGHSFGVSVGYAILQHTESGPRARRATRWALHEVSLTPVGADPLAKTRGLPETHNGESSMDTEVTTPDAPAKPTPQTRASMATLRTLQRSLGMDDAWLDSQVEADATEEQARAAADEIVRARAVRISNVRSPESENPAAQRRNREDALFARITGTAPADGARQLMGLSIVDMGADILQSQGVATRGQSREEIYRRALGTSDLPLLLQGVGDRVLLAEYQSLASPLAVLFATRSATDFRDLHNLKFDGDGVGFRSLTEHGEIKKVAFKESGESYSLDTFAMGWDWTRKAIINDDLGALSRGPAHAGRLAAEKTTAQYVALVESNPSVEGAVMFSTGRGNLAAAAGNIVEYDTAGVADLSALSVARKALRMMKGLDGVTPIASTPKYLIVHPERETEAEKALATLAAANVEDVNPFSGKLSLLVEPRLTSESAWYVAAGNGQNFERAFLNGREGPTVESNPAWDTLGVSFRSWFDLGVGVRDWRFVYKNAG